MAERYTGSNSLIGFIEQRLLEINSDDKNALTDLLDKRFPIDYDGDQSPPVDASQLMLVDGITRWIWKYDAHERQRLFVIMYRGLIFANEIATCLVNPDQDLILELDSALPDLYSDNPSQAVESLYGLGHDYLAVRPELDAIVTCFVAGLSPGEKYESNVADMCGAWLRMFDYGYERTRLMEDMKAWDNDTMLED